MKKELEQLPTFELQNLLSEDSKRFLKLLLEKSESEELYLIRDRFQIVLELLLERKENGFL